MALLLTGKPLIAYLLKYPDTSKFKAIYYKFDERRKTPITLDEFYIFCLNFSVIKRKQGLLKQEDATLLFNSILRKLNTKLGEKNLLPFPSYVHLVDSYSHIDELSSSLKKHQLTGQQKFNIFSPGIFNSFNELVFLNPKEIIQLLGSQGKKIKMPKQFNVSRDLRFNIFDEKFLNMTFFHLHFHPIRTIKTLFLFAKLRKNNPAAQKIFEHLVYSYCSNSRNLATSETTLKLIQFFLKKEYISEEEFYKVPIFKNHGASSPLSCYEWVLHRKVVTIPHLSPDKQAHRYPFLAMDFQMARYLPMKKITLSHLFSLPSGYLSGDSLIKTSTMILNTFPLDKLSFGHEFLFTALCALDDDAISKNLNIIEKFIPFLQLHAVPGGTKKRMPKLKSLSIFYLSKIFPHLIHSKTLQYSKDELENILEHIEINVSAIPPFGKHRISQMDFVTENTETLRNLLLEINMREDIPLITPSKQTHLRVNKF